MKPVRRRAVLLGVAVVLVIAGVLLARRHEVIAALLPRIVSNATGYDVAIGSERIGTSHAALLNVRVTNKGELVLAARRVDVWYSLRDLLPGSHHRFGVTAIAIDHPQLVLARNADRGYNITFPQSRAQPLQPPSYPNGVPFDLTVRIRNGTGALQAPAAIDPAARNIRITNVSLDAAIDTAARTHYALHGAFVESKLQPFTALGTIDETRGYAMHHAYAASVPLAAIANYFIDSQAARILAGTASNVDVRAYALDVRPNEPVAYHLGGGLDLSGGSIQIAGLAQPLMRIGGRLQIVDDAFFSTGLAAVLGRTPVFVSGGIFDFSDPQYRLGIVAQGDLSDLRKTFSFSRDEAIAGRAAAHVVVEGALAQPVVLAHLDAAHATYRTLPLDRVHANIAFKIGTLYLAPVEAQVHGAAVSLRGALDIGDAVRSKLALHVDGPARALPYLGTLIGNEPLVADALLAGDGLSFSGFGALASTRGLDRAAAALRVDRNGIVDVAPFWFSTERGTIAGEYHLNRSNDTSAFWIDGSHVALDTPLEPGAYGQLLPAMPPLRGTLDRIALECGGPSGTRAIVGGALDAHALNIAGTQISTLHAQFAGTLNDAAVSPVVATGPWGSLDGSGALSLHALAVRGRYSGRLEGLRSYLGDPTASGGVRGTAALAIEPGRITIQGSDLALTDAFVHGLRVQRASGTIGVENGVLHVYNANAQISGGSIVTAGRYDRGMAIVADRVDGAHLLGLPLDAGTVSASGTLSGGSPLPHFVGGVVVRGGRVQQYDVSGSGLLALSGDAAHLDNVVGALDGTYALAHGDVTALTSGQPAYAVSANVPAGDVTRALHTLALPTYYSDGSYSAQLAIDGRGLNPRAHGPLDVGAGSVNGLDFINGRALLTASRQGAVARNGSVDIGDTHLTFAGGEYPRISGIVVRSSDAHFEDFNNFFDTGDTLAGRGSFRFDVVSQRYRISSNGAVNVAGLRYRNLPIGDTRANWSSAHNRLAGSLVVGGDQGTLHANGAITFAPSPQWYRVLQRSNYDVALDVKNLDTSTWVAALGFPEIPLTGRLAANATIAGTYPHFTVKGNASLQDGTLWRLPIEQANLAFANVGDRVRVDSGSLVAPGLIATLSGDTGIRMSDKLNLDVYLNSTDVPKLVAQLFHITVPIGGDFESTVNLRGTLAKPAFSAAFDASDASAYGVKIPSIFGSLVWDRAHDTLELRNAGAQFERGDVSLAGTLPLQLLPFGVGPSKAPISFDLALNGLDPSVFDTLFGHGTKTGGAIDGALAIGGVVGDPRISGRFVLVNGSYVSDLEQTPITKIAANLSFDRTQATVDRLFANFGRGTLDASGRISFKNGASFQVLAKANNAQLTIPALGSGALDGSIALARVAPALATLGGDLTLHDATIPFSAFLAATQANNGGTGGLPLNVGFDMNLNAGKNVRVRGSGYGAGLDIGATGGVHLAGTLREPTLAGRFSSTSGTLTYFDRAFRVQDARVVFNPADGIIPTLAATGTTHVSNPNPRTGFTSADVTIDVNGPINQLRVAFSSNPPGYTNEQILAMIAPFSSLIGGVAFTPAGTNQSINGITPYGALNPVPGAQSIGPSSTATVGQEAFNVLNAQFTAGVLAPFETALSKTLGVNDVNLNVDYYGNVGFSVTRLLGKTVNFIYSQSFGIPSRYEAGLQLVGSRSTSAQLSFFWTTGPQRLFETPGGTFSSNSRVVVGQPLQGSSGFSFTLQRLYW